MLSLAVNKNSFRNVEKIKCFSKFNVKFHQVHTDNLIILIKWITLIIFITTTPLCKYILILILDFIPIPIARRFRTLWCCCFFPCPRPSTLSSCKSTLKQHAEPWKACTRKGIKPPGCENLSLNQIYIRNARAGEEETFKKINFR